MGSNECTLQMSGLNDYTPSASSQHIAAMSDMHDVVPMMANPDVVPLWMPDSPSSGHGVLRESLHNSPIHNDLGGARSWSFSHPATGGVYLPPRGFQIAGPIGHILPISSQRSMAASDTHSVPMMTNLNTSSWAPGHIGTAISDDWPQCVYNIRGARSGFSSHPAIGRVYLPPHAFLTPEPIGHTSPVYSQCGMTASDIHPDFEAAGDRETRGTHRC